MKISWRIEGQLANWIHLILHQVGPGADLPQAQDDVPGEHAADGRGYVSRRQAGRQVGQAGLVRPQENLRREGDCTTTQ
jgi:hypothetical protein